MRRLIPRFVFPAIVATLVACGGGGSDPQPIPSTVAEPSTSSEVNDPSERARILAVSAVPTVPVTGVALTALPIVSAGEIIIDGGQQFVTFMKTAAGQYYGVSDALGTYLVDPADVKQICVNSSQIGWNVPGFTSRSCSPLDANGFATLPRTCNKDLVAYNLDTFSGKKLWFDHVSERKFVRKGIASTVQPNGLIAYGGYVPATVSLKAGTAAGTADLTYSWNNNCMGGFGKAGKLTDLNPNLDPADPDFRYIAFLWNSNKVGWGMVPIGNRVPSSKLAFASFDAATNGYSVTWTGLACNDRGNITVYKGTGPANAVVYDPGKDATNVVDGFGEGWGIVQKATDLFQFWSIAPGLPTGVSLTFDRVKFQTVWTIAGCTT